MTTITTISATVLWLVSTDYKGYAKAIKSNQFSIIALILFAYLGLSLLWTDNISEGLSFWKKYREFILITIFTSYFSHNNSRQHGLVALYSGMCASLFISYLIYFNLIPFPSRHHSIENDIFNGILFAFLAYWSLNLALNHKTYRILFLAIFIASLGAIFVIRDGRTGYLLFISLTFLFVFQHWKLKGLLILGMFSLPVIYFLIMSLLDLLNLPIEAIPNIDRINLNQLSKLDIRLEYYINTIRVIFNHYLVGVGIGSFASAYLITHNMHTHFWPPTDNAHNEFFMIWVQTGLPGLILFILFFIYLFKAALKLAPNQSNIAIAVITTTLITCLFNSSILDLNDGVLLMLLIALFFSQPFPANSQQ